ncbi:MAG: hypothetical protein WBL15_03185 [Phycisphaerae bacterium]|nr:hypothetical protein [Phycisphaerae bacterium]HQE42646.1 hypothetical protein [Phycisphaerae bacterium]
MAVGVPRELGPDEYRAGMIPAGVDGVLHYGMANMPGAAGRTSTFALANVTTSCMIRLADLGRKTACVADPGLVSGINLRKGRVTGQAGRGHDGHELSSGGPWRT